MQAKRKSPFVGNTVPLADGNDPILYPRYTNPADVLLGGAPSVKRASRTVAAPVQPQQAVAPAAAPPAAAPVADNADAGGEGEPIQKHRKKPRWTDERKELAKKAKPSASPASAVAAADAQPAGDAAPSPAAGEPGTAEQGVAKEKAQKKKAPALRKLAPEERVSGPGNAEEAEQLRATLGFAGVAAAAAPEAAAPPPAGAFAFGFAGGAGTPAAVPAANVNADVDDSSGEDSSSDEEDEAAAPAAAAAPGGSDDDSSSSEESSSSSDDDDAAAGAAAPAPAPAQPAYRVPAAPAAFDAAGADSEFVPRRVYAGGMPFSYTESQVREFWEYCGAIESLDLLTFPDTGRFRGIAFITYATEEGFQAAMAADGDDCDGQTLKVQRCRWSAKDRRAQQQAAMAAARAAPAAAAAAPAPAPAMYAAAPPPAAYVPPAAPAPAEELAPPRPQHLAPAPKVSGYDVAYVGNIAYEADEAAVRALFEPYGVTKVRIHTDKDTGRPKGFAHIHFKDEASLDSAMVLDGTQLLGRRIKVGYAQMKKPQAVASPV